MTFLESLKAGIPPNYLRMYTQAKEYLGIKSYSREVYWDTLSFLKKSQWWSQERLQEYQLRQLLQLVDHAYQNVPYYQRVFDEYGLHPSRIQDFDDFQKIPLLTKEIVREHFSEFIAGNYEINQIEFAKTGGSMGIPLEFYYDRQKSLAREDAFIRMLWERAGWHPRSKTVVLRGDIRDVATFEKFWEYNPFQRELYLSSMHMTQENLTRYISKIRDFKPAFLYVYPSSLTILASFMRYQNAPPVAGVKTILCGSETLYPWQRRLFEEVFQCRVYSWYGHSELCVLAGECEVSQDLHLFPEYGYAEMKCEEHYGHNSSKDNGEIVATGFNNYAFPLIRYRTGDRVVSADHQCECGREYPLFKSAEGRVLDFVVTRDYSYIPLSALEYESLAYENGIAAFQIMQEVPGQITVRIVRSNNYNAALESRLFRLMHTGLHEQIQVDFEYVDRIETTPRGKRKLLIQNLPLDMEHVY